MNLHQPILIGGSGSTGSSLLASVLNRHSKVHCGPEMGLLNKPIYGDWRTVQQMLPQWIRVGVPTNGYFLYFGCLPHEGESMIDRDTSVRLGQESQSTREFIDRVQQHCIAASGKERFAEQTPSNCYEWRPLVAVYPEATILHMVRDGRDVTCSLMRRGFDIFRAGSRWLYDAACAFSCRDLPNYIECRYEQLAADPPETLRRLCAECNLGFEPQMLEPDAQTHLPRSSAVWRSTPAQAISTTSVGRFRQELSEADYSVFAAIRLTRFAARRLGVPRWSTVELLDELGYPIDDVPRKPRRYEAWKWSVWDQLRRTRRLWRYGYWPRQALTTV